MSTRIEKTEQDWQEELTPEQYDVLRRAGTEPPFTGQWLFNKEAGAYACAACGTALFASEAKFDSGTGWPSFTEPANREHVELRTDSSHGMARTEVLCGTCGSHLGHVFDDGPGESGERYCMNSLALDFKPGDPPAAA